MCQRRTPVARAAHGLDQVVAAVFLECLAQAHFPADFLEQAHFGSGQVRVGGVPILYSPYASFPIDDRRKSGFLAPKIGGGSDGIFAMVIDNKVDAQFSSL